MHRKPCQLCGRHVLKRLWRGHKWICARCHYKRCFNVSEPMALRKLVRNLNDRQRAAALKRKLEL